MIKHYNGVCIAYVDAEADLAMAGRIIINRDASRIVIKTSYAEHVELPLFVRAFHFSPQVVRTF